MTRFGGYQFQPVVDQAVFMLVAGRILKHNENPLPRLGEEALSLRVGLVLRNRSALGRQTYIPSISDTGNRYLKTSAEFRIPHHIQTQHHHHG